MIPSRDQCQRSQTLKAHLHYAQFLVRFLNAFIWKISSPPIGEISGSELRFPARIELKEASYLSSKDAYLSTEEIYAFSIPMNFFYSFELLLEF